MCHTIFFNQWYGHHQCTWGDSGMWRFLVVFAGSAAHCETRNTTAVEGLAQVWLWSMFSVLFHPPYFTCVTLNLASQPRNNWKWCYRQLLPVILYIGRWNIWSGTAEDKHWETLCYTNCGQNLWTDILPRTVKQSQYFISLMLCFLYQWECHSSVLQLSFT